MAGRTLVTGDSFGNEGGEYPSLLNTTVDNQCVAGDEIIADIEPIYSTTLANRTGGTEVTQVVMQGGVNDIRNGAATAAQIMAAVASMTAEALATTNIDRVFVVGIGPWAGHATWNSGFQTITDEYNALAAASASTYGYTFVGIYDALEGSTPDEIDATYSDDDIHPNAAGSQVIADLINAAMGDFTVALASGPVELWRGAVEPTETGGSGNEYQAYRGAVEPAYVAPTPTPDPSSSTGRSKSKTRRELPQYVELPNGEFVQVANEQEADEIRAMFEKAKQAERPTQSVKTKSAPKMTPEIERALAKLRKQPKEVTRGSSLLGKKRGFL